MEEIIKMFAAILYGNSVNESEAMKSLSVEDKKIVREFTNVGIDEKPVIQHLEGIKRSVERSKGFISYMDIALAIASDDEAMRDITFSMLAEAEAMIKLEKESEK